MFVYFTFQKEVYPMCVLDFYVHESRQRSGCGKRLYEYMLQDLKVQPRLLAIDRPSPKLVAFMRKHYDLASIIPQVNNYVIYDGFFSNRPFECSPGPKRARIYMGKLQYVWKSGSSWWCPHSTTLKKWQLNKHLSKVNVSQSLFTTTTTTMSSILGTFARLLNSVPINTYTMW